ncbi:hypothetical protein AB674_21260 [Flavobacterium sp. ABG]|nr:hypothetical protein AB674_21260 [Flavobacterium sp. ABG]
MSLPKWQITLLFDEKKHFFNEWLARYLSFVNPNNQKNYKKSFYQEGKLEEINLNLLAFYYNNQSYKINSNILNRKL